MKILFDFILFGALYFIILLPIRSYILYIQKLINTIATFTHNTEEQKEKNIN